LLFVQANRMLLEVKANQFCGLVLSVLAVCLAGCEARQDAKGKVATLLTRIDDGDAKQATLAEGTGNARFDARQDDAFSLLQPGSISFAAGDPGLPLKIVLDRTKTYQTMTGHGAAMTDSSAWVLMNLKAKNPALFEYVLQKLFSPTDGAGFSFLRLPMGASDYTATARLYTYCDEASRDLSQFSIDHDREYIIPALKEARRVNPEIYLLASPWSPPAWMKTNGKLEGITPAEKAAGATCRLKPDCFEIYADYFVKFLEAYQAAGVEVNAVTLQNEPQFDTARYPCMRMDEDEQIKLVKLLGPRLAARSLKTRIFIHDHNWSLHADDLKGLGGARMLDPVASATRIMSDPVASRFIAGSAWHCYSGGVREMKHAYTTMRERFPDKQLFCTELSGWGTNRGRWFGDVEWGMVHNWMGGPQNGCEASVQWNLALDHKFGPTLRSDSQATAMVAVNTDRYDEARFEREYYAMAQMSRAARPGSRRIEATLVGADGPGLDVIAFALKDNRTSLVVFNKTRDEKRFQVDSGGRHFTYLAPARCIVTFIW
jgi:glucosylceramidase